MSEYLTTRETAQLLRVKERQVYELAAKGQLPVRRVTGKLLFARAEIEAQLHAGGVEAPAPARPLVFAGGHDPLLEWALRESRSGIAAFLDGALDGLERAAAGECIAAGLHIPEGDGWNVACVSQRFGSQPWVLIGWARRTRGLVIGRDVARRPSNLSEARALRFQPRQPEAGSEKVLDLLLAREGLRREDLNLVDRAERSETDLALAISQGRAEVGLGIAAAARQFNLDFAPLIEERFDLMVWRRAYFDPPFQKFANFCRSDDFRRRAETLGGYDFADFGAVRFNGA
jgi:putative molybdopterin biosynthesis protein